MSFRSEGTLQTLSYCAVCCESHDEDAVDSVMPVASSNSGCRLHSGRNHSHGLVSGSCRLLSERLILMSLTGGSVPSMASSSSGPGLPNKEVVCLFKKGSAHVGSTVPQQPCSSKGDLVAILNSYRFI